MNINIETEIGDIDLTLDSNNAPKTSEYFASLLERNELDNTSFFRIVAPDSLAPAVNSVPIAVVQFGHWEELSDNLTQIDHETTEQTGLQHTKWSLSTARYGPGQVYGSFFVCMRDEASFDFGGDRHPDGTGFAKFGEVTSGFSVLEQIFSDRSPEEFQQNPIQILRIRKT